MSDNTVSNNTLTYKGRPLLRKDNIIYYGSTADKYITVLHILSTKKINGLDVADKVSVQLQLTDPEISSKDRTKKSTTKDGLYNAMDFASTWLERELRVK